MGPSTSNTSACTQPDETHRQQTTSSPTTENLWTFVPWCLASFTRHVQVAFPSYRHWLHTHLSKRWASPWQRWSALRFWFGPRHNTISRIELDERVHLASSKARKFSPWLIAERVGQRVHDPTQNSTNTGNTRFGAKLVIFFLETRAWEPHSFQNVRIYCLVAHHLYIGELEMCQLRVLPSGAMAKAKAQPFPDVFVHFGTLAALRCTPPRPHILQFAEYTTATWTSTQWFVVPCLSCFCTY